jgi:hypothetical protein
MTAQRAFRKQCSARKKERPGMSALPVRDYTACDIVEEGKQDRRLVYPLVRGKNGAVSV